MRKRRKSCFFFSCSVVLTAPAAPLRTPLACNEAFCAPDPCGWQHQGTTYSELAHHTLPYEASAHQEVCQPNHVGYLPPPAAG